MAITMSGEMGMFAKRQVGPGVGGGPVDQGFIT